MRAMTARTVSLGATASFAYAVSKPDKLTAKHALTMAKIPPWTDSEDEEPSD